MLYRGDTAPFMSTWRLPLPFIRDENGQPRLTDLPCFEPPFGQIGVIDLNTNKLLWKRGLGSMKESGPFGIQTGLPFMVGTPLQAGNHDHARRAYLPRRHDGLDLPRASTCAPAR